MTYSIMYYLFITIFITTIKNLIYKENLSWKRLKVQVSRLSPNFLPINYRHSEYKPDDTILNSVCKHLLFCSDLMVSCYFWSRYSSKVLNDTFIFSIIHFTIKLAKLCKSSLWVTAYLRKKRNNFPVYEIAFEVSDRLVQFCYQ